MTYSTDIAAPAITLVTAPAAEPITAAQVKLIAGYDSDLTAHDDILADVLIPAARQDAEHRTGRKFISQTWDITLDAFPSAEIDLRCGLYPIASVTSVTYLDANGDQQTLDSGTYVLDVKDDLQPWLLLADGAEWPATYDSANAVVIRVVVGYGAAGSDVPKPALRWMLGSAAAGIPQSGFKMTDDMDRMLDSLRVWSA